MRTRGGMLELVQRNDQPEYDQARYQVGYAADDIETARRQLIARGAEPVTGLEGTSLDSARRPGRVTAR